MRPFAFLLILVVLTQSAAGLAAVEPGETVIAAEVLDGDTLLLEDGRTLRLAGIQAPKPPPGRSGSEPWPLAEAAKAALARLTLGGTLRLGGGEPRHDRYGRVLAHLYTDDGRWVQAAFLAQGLARVYRFDGDATLTAQMLAQEQAARRKRLGIWADRFYAVRSPEAARRDIGSFQIVTGRVLEASDVRRRIYLNFGPDWHDDFTVTIAPEVRPLFKAAGIDPLDFEGRRIRVRGWVKSFNGPMIEVSRPEQIELLAD